MAKVKLLAGKCGPGAVDPITILAAICNDRPLITIPMADYKRALVNLPDVEVELDEDKLEVRIKKVPSP